MEDYFEFLKGCISLKEIQKYTIGIEFFLNEIKSEEVFLNVSI